MSESSSLMMKNAGFLVGTNAIQKIIMFLLNQSVLIFTSPEILGIVSIKFEFWVSTILFLSREGTRLGCLRYPIYQNNISPIIIQSFITFIVAVIILLAIMTGDSIYHFFSSSHERIVFLFYGIACLIECLGEPWYNFYLSQVNVQPKAIAETFGLLAKSIFLFLFIIVFKVGLFGFGFAQIAYSVFYLGILISFGRDNLNPFQYLQVTNTKAYHLDYQLCKNCIQLTGMSIVKHFLTEADKISLNLYCSSRQQGNFAIANNYGSLIARLVYLPIEESIRLSFSKASNNLNLEIIEKIPSILNPSDIIEMINKSTYFNEMKSTFLFTLKFVLFLGITISFFGPIYLEIPFLFLKNTNWDTDEVIDSLIFFCYYLLVLGVNGVSEAVVQSIGYNVTYSTAGLVFSCITFFLFSKYCIDIYSSAGIVLISTFAMLVRVIWNFYLIFQFFSEPYKYIKSKSPDLLIDYPSPNKNKVSFLQFKFLFPNFIYIIFLFFFKFLLYFTWWRFTLATKSISSIVIHLLVGVILGLIYLYLTYQLYLHDDERHLIISFLSRRSKAKNE